MKQCVNCGREILDVAKFCIYCNARQPEMVPEEGEQKQKADENRMPGKKEEAELPESPAEVSVPENEDEELLPEDMEEEAADFETEDEDRASAPRKRRRTSGGLSFLKKHKTLAAVAAAVIVIFAVVLGLILSRPAVIDLAGYADVQFSGYDGLGSAKIEFQDDQFLYDLANAMAGKGVIRKSAVKGINPGSIREFVNGNGEDGTKVALAAEGIGYELDRQQGLSNGEEVTVKFRFDNEEAEQFKIRFKGEDKIIPVSSLSEMDLFDAFAGLDVTVSGPDGYGEAEIRKTGTGEEFSQLDFTADKEHDLHNGDRIKIRVTNRYGDDDFSEFGRIYGKMPKETSKTYDVSGLTEVPTFDAFANMSVTVEGVEPFGYIAVTNLDDSNDIWFEADRYDGLSNGDTVTVRAIPGYTGEFNEEYAEIYGQVPQATEKTLEIQGLPAYIRSLSDIPADTLTDMKRAAQDKLEEYVSTEWNAEYDRMNSGIYKGACLLTNKDEGSYWNQNQLYLIYEVNATAYSLEGSEDVTFYFYTRLMDVLKTSDGSCSFDTETADIPWAVFDTGINEHYYNGYGTMDALISDVIDSQAEYYNIEKDIREESKEVDAGEESQGETAGEESQGATAGEESQEETAGEESQGETAGEESQEEPVGEEPQEEILSEEQPEGE